MMRYEVRLDVNPALAGEVERYMLETHIAEVMATGCFLRAHFDREESGQYRTTYVAASRGEFDRYTRDHADGLRADFLAHFPEGASPTRELWTELGAWEAA